MGYTYPITLLLYYERPSRVFVEEQGYKHMRGWAYHQAELL